MDMLNALKSEFNYKTTTNGATALKSTLDNVYDLFAFGGAYRERSDWECVDLFLDAWDENPGLALKCLFYLRDIRGGQGERRFFRVVMSQLAASHPDVVIKNFDNIVEMGRWDDLWIFFGTPVEQNMILYVIKQLKEDINSEHPSLLGKWMPSINASSNETRRRAHQFVKYLGVSNKTYRKMLSKLRAKIHIVETQMSSNEWPEINYAAVPSKAGINYRNAFRRHDEERYMNFINSKDTKVHAGALVPADVVHKALACSKSFGSEAAAIQKYWDNLTDYFKGASLNALAMVDVSGSMHGTPMEVAISLGLYCAERMNGPFHNHFMTFSSLPDLVEVRGQNIVDKIKRMSSANWGMSTDLVKALNTIRDVAVENNVPKEQMPEYLIIISDMEIDSALTSANDYFIAPYDKRFAKKYTTMDIARKNFAAAGYECPKLIYWNVNARNNTLLSDPADKDITYVSGYSPVLFEQVLKGKTNIDLMLDKLNSERYSTVVI